MKFCSELAFTVFLLASSVGYAQPWSVAATNSTRQPVLPQNWNTVVTAATPVATVPFPAAPAPQHPTPPPANPMPQFSNFPMPAGVLAVDQEQKEYNAKHDEINVPFTFNLTNISAGAVTITLVHTSCGCTTAKIQLPMTLGPGGTAEIPINMNLAGKAGVVIKSVTLHTDKGQKPLQVKANIQAPPANSAAEAMNRQRNQQIALADRQAVFKGDCAKCHVEPLIGKTGKELYTAACGICHESEHRATMVTDLHNLKTAPTAEYWNFFTVNGKPGTLMPAFAHAQGGPLSDAQIASLVEYLVKEFPQSKTTAPAHAHAH